MTMELFYPLIFLVGAAIALILFIILVKRLFSPARLRTKTNDAYSLSAKGSDLSYYNQAVDVFAQARTLKDQPHEFTEKLFQIIHLCQMEINHARFGATNGDAVVLLANAYYLMAMMFSQSKVYDHCIVRSLALIKRWHDTPMHTRNRDNGKQIYAGIMAHVRQVEGGLSQKTRQNVASILEGTDVRSYSDATTLGDIEKIKLLIATHAELEAALNHSEDNPQEAIAICTRILEKQPDNATCLYIRSIAYQTCELYEKAIDDLDRAIDIEPYDGYFYGMRGQIYFTMHRYVEALDDTNYAITLKPEVGLNYATRGFVLLNLGRRQEAIESLACFVNSPDVDLTTVTLYVKSSPC